MAKAPAFQLYAADFYMDTASWTAAQIGVYFRLLMYEWVNGGIPESNAERARIAGIDHRSMAKMWSVVVAKKFTMNVANMYVNPRMEEIRNKQIKYIESQRLAGIKGAEAKRKMQSNPTSNPTSERQALLSSSSSSYNTNNNHRMSFADFKFIHDYSKKKVYLEIEQIADCLYKEKLFLKAHSYKNTMAKAGNNPRAILYTLLAVEKYKPKKPWGYCKDIISKVNGNYNAEEYQREHQ